MKHNIILVFEPILSEAQITFLKTEFELPMTYDEVLNKFFLKDSESDDMISKVSLSSLTTVRDFSSQITNMYTPQVTKTILNIYL